MTGNLQDLKRSAWFLKLGCITGGYSAISVLSVEVSCTVGDLEPTLASEQHQNFAYAIAKAENLEELTFYCHGQTRLDIFEAGMDPYLRVLGRDRGTTEMEEMMDDKAPIWRKLRKFGIIGKSGSTHISEAGMHHLIMFIGRHCGSLKSISLENMGVKSDRQSQPLDRDKDVKYAEEFWVPWKEDIVKGAGEGLESLELKKVMFTIVREGSAANIPPGQHSVGHFYQWPFETDIVFSSPAIDEPLEFVSYHIACGCEFPAFEDDEPWPRSCEDFEDVIQEYGE
ncbi:hypothetical protein ABW19_dt0206241 [Dactylella cylindrospora]|nr:hypothetical protein ABW19_dt0206241 [Dactylella cylindrospora]